MSFLERHIGPCFSECGPGAGSISISWDLVRDAESSPPQASWTSISPVTRSQGICVHIQVWETLVWSTGHCLRPPGSAVPWALPSRGARRQWWKERVWLLQTHRGGRRCSQRGHHSGMWEQLLGWQHASYLHSALGPRGPAGTGNCHHPASNPQSSGQWDRASVSPGQVSHTLPPALLCLRVKLGRPRQRGPASW